MTEAKKKKPTLEALIMRLLHEADGRLVNPMVVAKHFAEGRKGEPADPEKFRGVYRIGLPDAPVVEGEGEDDEA